MKNIRSWFLFSVFAASLIATSCGGGDVTVGYRSYDPYYRDYHTWDNAEIGYYNTWIVDTHRPHREYKKLSHHDQEEYWKWRHSHNHDHH